MPPETHIYARPAFESQDQYNKRMAQEAAVKAERMANRAVAIPEGEISTEMLGKIERENTGLYVNKRLELLDDDDTPASVKATLIAQGIERGHGKVQGDTVNVQVNNITTQELSESDKEILALYVAKKAKMIDSA